MSNVTLTPPLAKESMTGTTPSFYSPKKIREREPSKAKQNAIVKEMRIPKA
jgi:hypothetical protein